MLFIFRLNGDKIILLNCVCCVQVNTQPVICCALTILPAQWENNWKRKIMEIYKRCVLTTIKHEKQIIILVFKFPVVICHYIEVRSLYHRKNKIQKNWSYVLNERAKENTFIKALNIFAFISDKENSYNDLFWLNWWLLIFLANLNFVNLNFPQCCFNIFPLRFFWIFNVCFNEIEFWMHLYKFSL